VTWAVIVQPHDMQSQIVTTLDRSILAAQHPVWIDDMYLGELAAVYRSGKYEKGEEAWRHTDVWKYQRASLRDAGRKMIAGPASIYAASIAAELRISPSRGWTVQACSPDFRLFGGNSNVRRRLSQQSLGILRYCTTRL
jgi:hypothetical protein